MKLYTWFLAFFLACCGCATNNAPLTEGEWRDGYTWYKSGDPLPIKGYFSKTTDEIKALCGNPNAAACAIRIKGVGCWIFLPDEKDKAPAWLVRHEEWHCLGWDHINNAVQRNFVPRW